MFLHNHNLKLRCPLLCCRLRKHSEHSEHSEHRNTWYSEMDDISIRPGDEVTVHITSSSGSSLILPVVVALILLAFFFWLAYSTGVGISQSQALKESTGWYCSPGQCAVDMSTGEKLCPSGSDRQPYDITTQICSNKYSCSASGYGYAVLSDGSTDVFGVCEEGVACRCVNRPHCSRYVSSIFQTVSGNPYTAANDAQFTQKQASLSQGSIDGPAITSNNNSFCEIPSAWLFRSVPGCGALPPQLTTFSSLKSCFDSNPCLYGTLAYVTDDSDVFDSASLNRIPVACVAGEDGLCENDPLDSEVFNVPVYDTRYGGIVCKRVFSE